MSDIDKNDNSIPDPETLIRKSLSAKYDIQEKIGSGGMAVVYKAVQRTLNRPVAIKIVHQNFVHDKEFIDRFIKEARVAASLNHPNIITIHDVDSIGQVNYMTMEYLDGEPLSNIIRRKGTLGIAETLRIVVPIAQALDYLHKAGYIHRDVKSGNIFLSSDGRPVLTDFGIVHTNESLLSQPGTVLGTPEFMSPEQANGQEIDGRSDLYSLGVIMYECLTGRMPFRTDNPLTTVFKVINEPPKEPSERNPKIPDWLNSQILNLLSKNPENRVQTGKKLAANLVKKQVVNHEFGGEPPKPVKEKTPPVGATQKINIADIKKAGELESTKKQDTSNKEEVSQTKSRRPLLILVGVLCVLLTLTIVYLNVEGKGVDTDLTEENEVPENDGFENIVESDDNTVYTKVDVHPEFPGGISAYYDYAQQNINTPEENSDVSGKVLVEFVVETDGSISNVNTIKSLEPTYDQEAERLIGSLPKFRPGVLNGKAVRVKVILPVQFDING